MPTYSCTGNIFIQLPQNIFYRICGENFKLMGAPGVSELSSVLPDSGAVRVFLRFHSVSGALRLLPPHQPMGKLNRDSVV